MKTIYLDCFAGISGNMLLGALIAAGLPEEKLRETLAKLPVDNYELKVEAVNKLGVAATYVDVVVGHGHHHRHLPDIFRIIDEAELSPTVTAQSKKVFSLLAEAEAKVHGTTPDHVHFHEVGAVDSIVDIVGNVFALDYLGIERVYASPVHVGSGWVRCSHGLMPVPAPATAELLKAVPTYQQQIEKELTTPTGAALLAAYSQGFGNQPDGFKAETVAYGAGSYDLEIPNVLRLYLGNLEEKNEDLWLIETNIDDSTPQVLAFTIEKLLSANGVCDAWLTPIIMKKGRAASMVSVLVTAEQKAAVAELLLQETSSIGLRYHAVGRTIADRRLTSVQVEETSIRVKVSSFAGRIIQVMPEYDDCAALAKQSGIPLKRIQQTARQLAWEKVK